MTQTRESSGGSLADELHRQSVKSRIFRRTQEVRLGRYLVLEKLGEGGTGSVFVAFDPSLDRKVAIKLLTDVPEADSWGEALEQEARAMARLSHPNVVHVYEVAQHAGRRYVVMELVTGSNLRTWQGQVREHAGRSAALRTILDAYVQAGRGLAAAHRAELVHGDFKPDNVLIDEDERVRVCDFGLARSFEADALPSTLSGRASIAEPTSDSQGASHSVVMGTPAYMAPEQLRGDKATPRSDQFSYCVALYEALVGRRPFDRATVEQLEAAAHGSEVEIPRPSLPLPRYLWVALRRGMAAEPEQRFEDMEALLRTIDRDSSWRRWVTVGVVTAALVASLWPRTEAEPPCRGARGQLVGVWDDPRRAEAEAALLGLGARYGPSVWEHVAGQLDRYADQWVASHTEACEATTVRKEQSPALMDLRMGCLHRAQLELLAVTQLLTEPDAEVLDKAHELVAALPPLSRCADVEALQSTVEPPEPAQESAVEDARRVLAQVKAERRVGRYASAQQLVARAEERVAEVEYEPIHAEIALWRGRVLRDRGEYAASEEALREALASALRRRDWELARDAAAHLIYVVGSRQGQPDAGLRYRELAEQLAVGDPLAEGRAWDVLGVVYDAKGEYAQAEAFHRQALARFEQVLGPDDHSVAQSRENLANMLKVQGKYEEAQAEHRRVLALRERILGPEHPSVANSHHNLAGVANLQGDHETAEAEQRQALALYERALGPEHPRVAGAIDNLAAVLTERGQYVEAERLRRRALTLRRERLGPEHPEVAVSLDGLGAILQRQGKYAEAEAEHRRALQIFEQALGPEHPFVAQAIGGIGAAVASRGDFAQAEVEFRRALSIRLAALGPEHPDVAEARSLVGHTLYALGRVEEAEVELRKALTLQIDVHGPMHPETAETRSRLAHVLEAQDRREEAEVELRQVVETRKTLLGPEHPSVGETHTNLALNLESRGKDVDALEEYRRALEIFEASLDAEHPHVAVARANVANMLLAQGRRDEALALAEQAWSRVQREDIRPTMQGYVAYLMARVLWHRGASAADKKRARELAERARDAYARADEPSDVQVTEIRRWLERHQ